DGSNGLERGYHRHNVWKPDIHRGRPVNARVVLVMVPAVYCKVERSGRICPHGVVVSRRCESWNGGKQALIVTSSRQRKLVQIRADKFVADLGAVGLQDCR